MKVSDPALRDYVTNLGKYGIAYHPMIGASTLSWNVLNVIPAETLNRRQIRSSPFESFNPLQIILNFAGKSKSRDSLHEANFEDNVTLVQTIEIQILELLFLKLWINRLSAQTECTEINLALD